MKCPYCGEKLSYEATTFGLQKVAVVACKKLACPNGYVPYVAFAYSLKRAAKKAEKELLKSHNLSKELEAMVEAMNDPAASN